MTLVNNSLLVGILDEIEKEECQLGNLCQLSDVAMEIAAKCGGSVYFSSTGTSVLVTMIGGDGHDYKPSLFREFVLRGPAIYVLDQCSTVSLDQIGDMVLVAEARSWEDFRAYVEDKARDMGLYTAGY